MLYVFPVVFYVVVKPTTKRKVSNFTYLEVNLYEMVMAQCGTHHRHSVWPVPCDFDVAQWVCSMNKWNEKIEELSVGLFKSAAWNY